MAVAKVKSKRLNVVEKRYYVKSTGYESSM